MRSFSFPLVFKNKKAPFIAGLAVALFGLFAGAGLAVNKVSAADCSSNAIIYCGLSSPSNFISKVKSNDSGSGHHDLKAIYSAYGLEPASYDKFVQSSRQGKAYKNGNIVVDGRVAGTDGTSIGRESWMQGSGYFTKTIGGNKYYGNTNSKAFASDGLPVTVLFDSKGAMMFAVINSCGNPESFKPVTPSYSCNTLHTSKVDDQTYNFSSSASAGNGATIDHVVYSFGDGGSASRNSPSTVVNHHYGKAGNYQVKVTVYVNLPGNQSTTVSGGDCQKVITIVTPYYQCVQLAGVITDKSKYLVKFTVTAKSGNGAKLVSANFTFGDGKSQGGVKPTSATSVVTTHAYATGGSYDAAATLSFTVNGKTVTAPTCKARVTPKTIVSECKPGVPVGDVRCEVCQYDNSLPPNSPECVAPVPPELPNTGAGNTIAIFAVVVIGSFLIYRQLLFRRHKAAFLAAEYGTSPLPLGQPLDSDAPLAGTPLEQKRKSFRRNRPF